MDKRIALRDFSLLIALVLIAVYFYTRDPRFLSSRNLTQLGIELSAAYQFIPEQTTAAIVIHHPQAVYFSARRGIRSGTD